MATSFPFNYDLGPKQAQGTSIGDMVNLARGIQAYQQAEQINPLQVETAREQAAQAKLGTQAKGLELNDRQTGILYGLAGGVLNDPRIRSARQTCGLGGGRPDTQICHVCAVVLSRLVSLSLTALADASNTCQSVVNVLTLCLITIKSVTVFLRGQPLRVILQTL